MDNKIIIKKEKFNFDEKISTKSIAQYFTYLYSDKFIFQDNIMYYYNGVYWKGENAKFILSTFNIFLANDFYNKLVKQFNNYRTNKLDEAKVKDSDIFKIETKLIKLRKQLDDLVNSDRRIKYAKECLNYLTNIEVKFNRNQDLFAFNNKIFSLEQNKFIKPKFDQYISLTSNYDYEDPTSEDVEFIQNLIYSIFPDEELRTLYCIILASGLDGYNLEKLVCANGGGGNGKGLLNELAGCMFGNYYYVLPSNILTSAIKPGGASTELALMSYKRFVVAREPDTNTSINAGIVKEITGGSSLAARLIYSTDTDIHLHCTLILECNDKPKLSETNRSIQRRLVDVKFKQTFVTQPEYDEATDGLNEEEIKELRLGILNNKFKEASFKSKYKCALFYILTKYYAIHKQNNRELILPSEVISNSDDYMKDSDVLLQWINDNYEQTDNIKDNVKLKDVFNKFKNTEYFTDMKKVDKRVITYAYFQSKLVANLFLKKLVRTNSDKTYCLYKYQTKAAEKQRSYVDDTDSDED